MSRLIRQLLFMFGPLIFRQVTKLIQKKNNQQQWNRPTREETNQKNVEKPLIKHTNEREQKIPKDDKNLELEDDNFLLKDEDLKHIDK